jgi:hypothetical protein
VTRPAADRSPSRASSAWGGRDERFAQIDLRATAAAGLVLILTLNVLWLFPIAHGHSGGPYDWLAATGGLTYLLAVAFLAVAAAPARPTATAECGGAAPGGRT